jgi:pimeloyl-ACP methyl ester carboxylesterase
MANSRIGTLALGTIVALAVACTGETASTFGGAGADDPEATEEVTSTLGARFPGRRPSIILVHGSWADGTGWQHVIPVLESRGYFVTAVQNPLTGLPDDVTTTKRLIDGQTQNGPVVVVAHSYGGAVITGAAADNPNVKALVYVNAFAPDVGETVGQLFSMFPTDLLTSIIPDSAGFATIDRTKFHDLFCADVSDREARVMAAAQKPITVAALQQVEEKAAWRTIPSWFIIGKEDLVISPDLQRFMSARMKARTSEIHSSHVSFISHPRFVAKVIDDAARATAR